MSLIHKALQKAGSGAEKNPVLPPLEGSATLAPPRTFGALIKKLLGVVTITALFGGGYWGYVAWQDHRTAAQALADEAAAAEATQAAEAAEAAALQGRIDAINAGETPAEVAQAMADGERAFHAGDLETALQHFSAVTAELPQYADGWNNLGIVHRRNGLLAEAEAAYAKAIELRPDFVEALNNQAVIKMAQGDGLAAVVLVRKALELRPSYADAYFNLAVLMEEEGNWRSAVEAYKSFLNHAHSEEPAFIEQVEMRIEDIAP